MNKRKIQTVTIICCAVFRVEILALRDRHWPDLNIRFQTSMLHMKPDKLAARLDGLLSEDFLDKSNALLVYGDCCMQMSELTEKPGVVRVRGNNCPDLMLGRDVYRKLSHAGTFFLFPEWVGRWKHIFTKELGLNRANAAGLMGDMHNKLVYLDTGVVPVPVSDLEECSQYCGLPWEIMQVSLEPLRAGIQKALDTLKKDDR